MKNSESRLKKIPVVVQLYPQDIHKADLMRELKINPHSLDKELQRQAAKYAFWSSLYSVVAAKVSKLQEMLDNLEAKLYVKYSGTVSRTTDIKLHVKNNKKFRALRARLRRWSDSERTLRFGVKSFEQRKDLLMALNANRRADKKSEGFREEEEE